MFWGMTGMGCPQLRNPIVHLRLFVIRKMFTAEDAKMRREICCGYYFMGEYCAMSPNYVGHAVHDDRKNKQPFHCSVMHRKTEFTLLRNR